MFKTIIGIPAHNEAARIQPVLRSLRELTKAWSRGGIDIVVLDDGSTDGTADLARDTGVRVECSRSNSGYGAALTALFGIAIADQYDFLLTMDADGQHDPDYVRDFLAVEPTMLLVSGSRYLQASRRLSNPPAGALNPRLAEVVSHLTGFSITDVACGMKRYKLPEARGLCPSQHDYGAALELWIAAWRAAIVPLEVPIPMIYLPDKKPLPQRFPSLADAQRFAVRALAMAIVQSVPSQRCAMSADSTSDPEAYATIGPRTALTDLQHLTGALKAVSNLRNWEVDPGLRVVEYFSRLCAAD